MSIWGLHLKLSHNSSGSDGSQSWLHLLRAGTLLTRHGAKTIIWSYPPAPGPLCQIWYLRGWCLPVILIFWMLTQWLEWTSAAATPLWSHLDSPEAMMKRCFSASLLLAPPEKPSASHLSSWTAVTRRHLIPFFLWNISLIPSYSLAESSPLVAFLWVPICAYGHFPILSYKCFSTQIKGKLDHFLCS